MVISYRFTFPNLVSSLSDSQCGYFLCLSKRDTLFVYSFKDNTKVISGGAACFIIDFVVLSSCLMLCDHSLETT